MICYLNMENMGCQEERRFMTRIIYYGSVSIIILFLLAQLVYGGEDSERKYYCEGDACPEIVAVTFPAPTSITICGNDSSTCAVIDFSGDSIKYSGEMPVEESAKVFFQHVFEHKKTNEELQAENEKLKQRIRDNNPMKDICEISPDCSWMGQ